MALTNAMELDELTENQADKFETHNDDLRRVQEAIAGTLALAMSDANYSLSTTVGSEEWRYKRIRVTGTLTANRDIVYPDKKGPHLFILENATTGGYSLTIKRSGQTGVTVRNGDMAICYHNGTDVIDAVSTNATIEKISKGLSGLTIVNMGGGSYSIPYAESGNKGYVFINSGSGATLTLDTSTHYYPADVTIGNYSANAVYIKQTGESGNGILIYPYEFKTVLLDSSNPTTYDSLIAYNSATGSRLTKNFTSDANITLTTLEHENQYYEFTDASSPTVLTAGRDIVFLAGKNIPRFIFKNSTAQTLTVKVSGQTGVAVTAGTTKDLYWDGTDIADAGAL